ncbi:hypothetical protein [Sphingobacterium sp. FBM7-1]|uniref:hypothetical protein n=1 Tax=Sphingobacterium sp. FBM7-1 TaxID=2886688 RepID=UPI001D10A6A5|nr:hypothetical protein [Sphingobacterium sp. FBM7-1]MCC2600308.1 hypothetical protein [Sphingobacterium sp. FBM7-1]
MKKKYSYIILLLLVGISGAWYLAKGRTGMVMDRGVMEAYPAAIVAQVYDIASRAGLIRGEQEKLAIYFMEKDRLANEAKDKGEGPDVFSAYYKIDYEEIGDILGGEDFNRYILSLYEDKGLRDYPLSFKLRKLVSEQKESLGLTTGQVTAILDEVKQNEMARRAGGYNIDSAENECLRRVLSDTQYRGHFYRSAEVHAAQRVADIIGKLQEADLIANGDSARIYRLLYPYEYERTGGLAYYRAMKENILHDRFRDSIACLQPDITILYDGHRNLHPWSWPLNILHHRDSLDLSGEQINSLVSMYRKVQEGEFRSRYLKTDDSRERFDRWEFEKTELVKVLTPLQIDHYLLIRNRKSAEEDSKKDWEKLNEHGLVQSADSIAVLKDLLGYRLRLRLSDEWIGIERSKKNEFAKRDIIDNRPELLKNLEEKIKADRDRNVVRF